MGEAKKARKQKAQPVHYPLTLSLAGDGHVHTYLIADDCRYLEHALSEMIDEAQRQGLDAFPMGLCTTLQDDGRETVRSVIVGNMPEAAEVLNAATDYHRTTWFMSNAHPDNARLMELH